jgi:Tfp pilus assembly protein PilN
VRAVNLIPLDQRSGSGPAAGRSGGGAYAVLVLLAGLALLAFLYGTARRQISSARAQVASLTAQTQQAQAKTSQLAPYTSFLTMREQRVQAVSALAESRFDWAHAVHELGRVLPGYVSISSLSGSVSSGSSTGAASTPARSGTAATTTVTSATPPGSVPTFILSGCATSQTAVAQTLVRLRLIDGVSEVTLQSSTKPGSAGSGGSAGCPGKDPAFSVQITFDPLPAAAATGSQSTTANTSATGSPSATTNASSGGGG